MFWLRSDRYSQVCPEGIWLTRVKKRYHLPNYWILLVETRIVRICTPGHLPRLVLLQRPASIKNRVFGTSRPGCPTNLQDGVASASQIPKNVGVCVAATCSVRLKTELVNKEQHQEDIWVCCLKEFVFFSSCLEPSTHFQPNQTRTHQSHDV